jgi:hypothetical protein
VSHACCGEPEPEVSAAPRAAAASIVGAGLASATSAAANALALAAAPTFALLALWTALAGGRSDMLCMGMWDASPLNGMTLMYALMSAFHAAPWLNSISRR